MRSAVLAFAFVPALAAASLVQSRADACGGCFAPPDPNDSTVVTDHRMVLSLSPQETTLYDQIRYSGSPSSFAWVLPIVGEAKVGISTDILFQALDTSTTTSYAQPPMNCPASPSGCYGYSYKNCPSDAFGVSDASAAPRSGNAAMDSGAPAVQVLKEETVGPYETVQLKSTDPNALVQWLADHGYALPSDVAPMVKNYASEGFNFLALKLVPGANTRSMKPVRVTTQGANPTLPLRMVAAGSGVSVGVTLWVLSDGRWQPQTFPSFAIESKDLVWTWASGTTNAEALRQERRSNLGPAAWEVESSFDLASSVISSGIYRYTSAAMPPTVELPDGGYGPYQVYDPVTLPDGGTLTQDELADEDLGALFQHHTEWRVTRMRSDLPRASLATDLALQAAPDQAEILPLRVITRESDEPKCSVYDGCKSGGVAPRSEARRRAADSCGGGDGSKFCATAAQIAEVEPAEPVCTGEGSGGSSGGGGLFGGSGCSVIDRESASGAPFAIAAMLGLTLLSRRRKR